MKRIAVIMLVSAMLLAAACSRDDSDLREDLSKVLKANPDLVLEVIKEHSETIYELAEQGANIKRAKAMRTRWEKDLRDPLKPNLSKPGLIMGNPNAPVTIVEYSDFECAYCAEAAENIHQLLQKYPDKFRVFFKHFPLPGHRNALMAARYVEAATMQDQDKAWELHYALFRSQPQLSSEGEAWLIKTANDIGLNLNKLIKDAASGAADAKINADMAEAVSFGIHATPSFLLNGVKISGALPVEVFEDFLRVSEDFEHLRALEAEKIRQETKSTESNQSEESNASATAPADNATEANKTIDKNSDDHNTAEGQATENATNKPETAAPASANATDGKNASADGKAINANASQSASGNTSTTNASKTSKPVNAPGQTKQANDSSPGNASSANATTAQNKTANANASAKPTDKPASPNSATGNSITPADKSTNKTAPAPNASEPIRPQNRTAPSSAVMPATENPSRSTLSGRAQSPGLDLGAANRSSSPLGPNLSQPAGQNASLGFGERQPLSPTNTSGQTGNQ